MPRRTLLDSVPVVTVSDIEASTRRFQFTNENGSSSGWLGPKTLAAYVHMPYLVRCVRDTKLGKMTPITNVLAKHIITARFDTGATGANGHHYYLMMRPFKFEGVFPDVLPGELAALDLTPDEMVNVTTCHGFIVAEHPNRAVEVQWFHPDTGAKPSDLTDAWTAICEGMPHEKVFTAK